MKRMMVLLPLTALLLLAGVVLAQADGNYDLAWNKVSSGAGMSIGGGYELGGTIGQPDAGALSGGGYTLAGGFWGGVRPQYRLYLPLLFKNYEL
jgi:uncharacterized membrane protein